MPGKLPKKSNGYSIHGVVPPAKALALAELVQAQGRLLVVTPTIRSAEALTADLNFFLTGTSFVTAYLPPWETLPMEPVSPELTTSAQRLHALYLLATVPQSIIVTSVEGALQRALPKALLLAQALTLSGGTSIPPASLPEGLELLGYVRSPRVEAIGQFAVRGGVLDLYPFGVPHPLRLTFLDDTIEKISEFNKDTQRSVPSKLESVTLLPLTERLNLNSLSLVGLSVKDALERIREHGARCETPTREIAHLCGLFGAGAQFPSQELISMLVADYGSLVKEYGDNTTIVVVNPTGAVQRAEIFIEQVVDRANRLKASQQLIPPWEKVFLDANFIEQLPAAPTSIVFDDLQVQEDKRAVVNRKTRLLSDFQIQLKRTRGTGAGLQPLIESLEKWRNAGLAVGIVVGSVERRERLSNLLREQYGSDIDYHWLSPLKWIGEKQKPTVTMLEGALSEGFQDLDKSILLIAEQQLFPTRSKSKRQRKSRDVTKVLASLGHLHSGDYVVHGDYGVGVYQGLKTLEIEGVTGDFLQIAYADSVLYLPVFNIGKVHKFAGVDGQPPTIDRLSSRRWQQTKQKVRDAVTELAGELIRLYAARDAAKGWRFDTYGAMDELFAEDFPYEETTDQLTAIDQTLSDMASERPMDRVICGDVGFGKTEVAIRAAFKATQHQKQIAVLAPTTILVEQHRLTFEKRFSDYPVKVEAISRLYSAKHQRETLARLASGEVDIIVGTHALLSSKIKFFDLGLLIVDEEHRFGVKHKEQIKQFKRDVDVLTLTATPIPRTLHMALLGIRDISVLTSAPAARIPVHSYLAHRESTLIRDALLREHARGGQAFYLYNRVNNIAMICGELAALVPEMRFAFAHGQMDEVELDHIMARFLSHEIDVLVSTTIIESGIDIPNANTIIIDHAHTFGLAQLYQLRGRVGRSDRQAYAYLLIPRKKTLTGDSHERLRVLQSLEDLGVGFELALQDLQIRGAGNLLGKEQSGSVAAVGFELYTRIVQEAVARARGEETEFAELIEPEVRIPLDCFVPSTYVPDIEERLLLYQRCGEIVTDENVSDLLSEAEERFGGAPVEFERFLLVMRLKATLRRYRIHKCEFRTGEAHTHEVRLSLSQDSPLDLEKLLTATKSSNGRLRLSKGLLLSLRCDNDPDQLVKITNLIEDVLGSMER